MSDGVDAIGAVPDAGPADTGDSDAGLADACVPLTACPAALVDRSDFVLSAHLVSARYAAAHEVGRLGFKVNA